MIGKYIGEYKILSEIGRGGMGIVYRAEHLHLRKSYALKILPAELSQDDSFINHFYTEARTMAALKHPGIVQVVYMGKEKNLYYLVMEYVASDDGKPKNLQELVGEKGGRLSIGEMELYLKQVCDALAYAHSYRDERIREGVVHRDLKPSNMLLGKNNKLKLSDFGLAKVLGDNFVRSRIEKSIRTVQEEKAGLDNTMTLGDMPQTTEEAILGTYEYMSPEQKAGVKVDHRSDIFSLGVVVYNLLTGKKPAGKFKNPSEIDPSIPAVWDTIIDKCLQQSPDDRFQKVGEIIARLKGMGAKKKMSGRAAALIAGGAAILIAASLFFAWMARHGEIPGEIPRGSKELAVKKPPLEEHPPRGDEAAMAVLPSVEEQTAVKRREREEELVKRVANEKYNNWYDRGIEKMLSGDREQAVIAFERALEYRDTQQARDQLVKIKYEKYLGEARTFAGKRDYEAAIVFYEKALACKKTREVEEEMKQVRRESEKEKSERKREELSKGYIAKAQKNEAQSQFRQAISAYRAALKYQPENTEIQERITRLLKMSVPVSPRMALIEAGEFWMGSDSSGAKENEKPAHRVYLDSYYIDKYEVTNKEYERFDPGHRKSRVGGDNDPATKASRDDAMAYCAWRSKKEGLPEGTYRLPTEAEWEKAAKGRSPAAAGVLQTTGLRQVESGSPNKFGIYNLPGNAWEWCCDWYDEHYYVSCAKLEKNPVGPSWGTTRIVRDVSLGRAGRKERVSSRMGLKPSVKDIKMLGFRCVRIK